MTERLTKTVKALRTRPSTGTCERVTDASCHTLDVTTPHRVAGSPARRRAERVAEVP
ncbi:MAG: hypothetical protein ACREDK_02195 [Thermoplasmata archaeon]